MSGRGLIHDASGGFGASLAFLSAIAALLIVGGVKLRHVARVDLEQRAARSRSE